MGRKALQTYWTNACLPQPPGKGKSTSATKKNGVLQDRDRHANPSPAHQSYDRAAHEAANRVEGRPRFYLMYATSTEDLARNMTQDGWYIEDGNTGCRKS